jgi:hypothetical protein
MASFAKVINDVFDEKLKNLHCAFIAKILMIDGNKAKIQPLGLMKAYGGAAKPQAPLTGVHIAKSAQYKMVDGQMVSVSVGDVVLCVCCDRNIEAALRGENELPPIGYHNQSDCVIVAII